MNGMSFDDFALLIWTSLMTSALSLNYWNWWPRYLRR